MGKGRADAGYPASANVFAALLFSYAKAFDCLFVSAEVFFLEVVKEPSSLSNEL